MSSTTARRRGDAQGLRVLVTGASGTFGRGQRPAHRARRARRRPRPGAPRRRPGRGARLRHHRRRERAPPAVAAAIDRLGGLDVLINNAGVGGPAPAELPPGAEVRRQLEINLLGTWRVDRGLRRRAGGRPRPRRDGDLPDGGHAAAAGRRVRGLASARWSPTPTRCGWSSAPTSTSPASTRRRSAARSTTRPPPPGSPWRA